MCLLRTKCGDDHLVTITERELINIAKSKLHEDILSFLEYGKIDEAKEQIKNYIKITALNKVETLDLSQNEKRMIMKEIYLCDFDDVIPSIN
jgi:hypothetical protein